MARTADEIRQIIKTKAREFPSIDPLLFSDDVGALQGSQFIGTTESVVAAQQAFELISDALKAEFADITSKAPSGNRKWIQTQILAFQFGDIIQIDDETFVPFYPVPDVSKQIVTRCSVFVDPLTSNVQIKVAKGDSPPAPLSTPEFDALQDYYFGSADGLSEGIGFTGIPTTFVSQDPDRIYVSGTARHVGQIDGATIKTNVIAAIENFIATFQNENFDGTIFMQDLTAEILAVEGVTRFDYAATDPIRTRPFNVAFGSATPIDPDSFYNTIAGYLISEDDAGNTLQDTILTAIEDA